ncbi:MULTISPECIES: hypothetical protein [unclassified Colwellia]|uniref:hypothetical protein n=1 Tax=unclassified Colwellia TaxID=196834 RepID=UPI0015F77633|nr:MULTISPECIES: hypothetical protein [unclassified Colwellia]MBA6232366.1 hypothetical protein [Colwellia sp. MB02u-7]MBA6236042.1 hypothetical protein [Colwellia sp. MB02u-11]MBA6256704.1 hypothetical protein [Colwellia sp. MB3u-28]MBA6261419.1 hypothetical protein [Colwellia sp. MB3u-41]MBA6298553.1 hypothetical protein [Colwellia sp. MB3u-22]
MNTVTHISTIRTNSLIIATLIFTMLWIVVNSFSNYNDLYSVEESFSEAVALNVIDRKISEVSSATIYPKNPSFDIKEISFTKADNKLLKNCSVLLKKDKKTQCTYNENPERSIKRFAISVINSKGLCLNKENLNYKFTMFNTKNTCDGGNFIEFSTVIIESDLPQLHELGMKSAATRIIIENNENKIGVSVFVNDITLEYTDKKFLSAYDFSLQETNQKFHGHTISHNLLCNGKIKSNGCYYQQLNKLSMKLSSDSVTIPYIATSFPSSIACIILLFLMTLASLSSYSASKIALKNIQGGLEQNYLPFDFKNNFISLVLIRYHIFLYGICLLITVLFNIPPDFIYKNVIMKKFLPLSMDSFNVVAFIISVVFIYFICLKVLEPLDNSLRKLRKERRIKLN